MCSAMTDLIKTYIIILRNLPCATSIIKCINKHVCIRFTSFCYSARGGRSRFLSSACKTEQADFIDWTSFLPSNPKEETSPNTAAAQIRKAFHQHREAGKTMISVKML